MIGSTCYYKDNFEETVIFFKEDSDEDEHISTLFGETQESYKKEQYEIFCFKNICRNGRKQGDKDDESKTEQENTALIAYAAKEEAKAEEDDADNTHGQVKHIIEVGGEAVMSNANPYLARMQERINPAQHLISEAQHNRAMHYAIMYQLGNYHQLMASDLAEIEVLPATLRNALDPRSVEEFNYPHNRALRYGLGNNMNPTVRIPILLPGRRKHMKTHCTVAQMTQDGRQNCALGSSEHEQMKHQHVL